MSTGADHRTVLFLDTNSLHYLDLFVRFSEEHDLIGETDKGIVEQRIDGIDDENYQDSIRRGCNIVYFALQEDALVEYSPVSKIELLAGRVKGAAIENAAKEGVPDRMWSRIDEREIRDRSIAQDLKRIRTRVDDLGSVLDRWDVTLVYGSGVSRAIDVLELASVVVGMVFMSTADSIVYASAIAARADYLVTGDSYLRETVNLIHNPSNQPRYLNVQRQLQILSDGALPQARDCKRL